LARVFLTGGTGFLGSHIAEALLAGKHSVVCSVRATSNTKWLDPLGVPTVEVDLSVDGAGRGPLAEALEGVDCVVHCAGVTSAPGIERFMEVNAEGTARLARAADGAGVSRFVLISSLASRGPDGAGGPTSPYGLSKLEGERRLAECRGGMTTAVLRPGGIYGPRDTGMLSLFKVAARGWTIVPGTDATVQPVHAGDAAAAATAAVSGPEPDEPLPVLGEDAVSWGDLGEMMRDAVGGGRVVRLPRWLIRLGGLTGELTAPLTGGRPFMDRRRARDLAEHTWTSEITETTRRLGWRPRFSLRQGLAATAAWYREAGWI